MQCDEITRRVLGILQTTMEKHEMIWPGDAVLVGVSGGADSVCLLHALKTLAKDMDVKIFAAHVNHGIRGEEALRDETFVRELCDKWGIRLFTKALSVPELAAAEGVSLETAGRLARYRYFSEICDEEDIQRIATAHNQNDQAETVLMRMMRGAGMDGLAGIRYCREDGVIRPLLDVSRPDIEAYCTVHDLTYCTDSTNGDSGYTRNRIRNQLIPAMEEQFNPKLVESLATLARNMAEDSRFIDGYTQRLYQRINSPAPNKKPVVLDMESLELVEPCIRTRLVRLAARDAMGAGYTLERRHMDGVLELLNRETGAKTQLPGGLEVAVRYGWLAFETPEITAEQETREAFSDGIHYDLELGRTYDIENYSVTLHILEPGEKLLNNQMVLDYDKVKDIALTVRTRQRGDRIAVYLDGRTRKLKDWMIDQKIPRWERGEIPLLCDDQGQVMAVIGHRVAEPYKLEDQAKKGLVITYDTVDESR